MLFQILISLVLALSALAANSHFGSLVTGLKSGTYIQIGNDLSDVFSKYDAKLEVVSTKGSIENLDILSGKNPTIKASWGIVQSDALEYYRFLHFKGQRKDIYNQVKTLMPLYGEHIHLFTKKGQEVKFERGGILKVGVPSRKSGAFITGSYLENALGVRFKYVYTPFDEASEYLKKGVLDLYIDVIAMPSNKYKNVYGLTLVELPKNERLQNSYMQAKFTKSDYSWLDKKLVKGYKVPSILVTNKVDKKDDIMIKVFLSVLLRNYKDLISNGHAKWKNIYRNRMFELKNSHTVARSILKKYK